MPLRIEPVTSSSLWETFLLQNRPSAVFQSYLWGQVQERLGTTIWRLGVWDGDDLVGVAQVVKVQAKRGAFLHVRHGPVFAQHKRSYWDALRGFLRSLAKREGAWFLRVSPLIEDNHSNRQFLASLGFIPSAVHAVDAELCWVLDLTSSEETLLANMRKTTRHEIKRALKLGVKIEKSTNPSDLTYFYKLYKETSDRHGFVQHTGIREELEIFASEKKALLFTARFQDDVPASAIVLFYGDQAIYHHSASTPTTAPVNYLLQWEAIKEAKKRGIKVYNFWGIAPYDMPNHPWRGLTLFKKGFGGREVRYIHSHDLPVSSLYAIPRTIESFRRIVKGY